MLPPTANHFVRDGVAMFADVLTPEEAVAYRNLLPADVAGQRNLWQRFPAIRTLAEDPRLQQLLMSMGVDGARPVRAVFFDKNPAHNWRVPWHQDLTIVVRKREEVSGYGPWSVKEGVPHVQPPAELLARMVTLRVHLDDCEADNGALRVRPGSHLAGRLPCDAIAGWADASEITCAIRAGGVVAMRPLLLHASAPAIRPAHRRVIHLEYSSDSLPPPLEWPPLDPAGLEILR